MPKCKTIYRYFAKLIQNVLTSVFNCDNIQVVKEGEIKNEK